MYSETGLIIMYVCMPPIVIYYYHNNLCKVYMHIVDITIYKDDR